MSTRPPWPPVPGWNWIPAQHAYGWWDGQRFPLWAVWVGDEVEYRDRPPRQASRAWRGWACLIAALLLGTIGLLALAASDTPGGGGRGSRTSLDDVLFDDRYSIDLTRDRTDFVATDAGAYASEYAPDGYHLLVRNPHQWAPAGVRSRLSHTVLGVEIATSPVLLPDGSAFGPGCWQDIDHGYEFVVAASGDRVIVEVEHGAIRELARVPGAPPVVGRVDRLLLTCVIRGLGSSTVELAGYVDGTRAVTATGRGVTSEFNNTGFAGHTTTAAPAEWRVTKFWRRGPDDLPR